MSEGGSPGSGVPDAASATQLPSASVVIPTFNRLVDLQRVLRALSRQRGAQDVRLEIIVVDDGSTDGTDRWLVENRHRTELIVVRQDNAGPAAARNRGAAVAQGEVLLFLGDDTEPDDDWLVIHLEEHRLFSPEHPAMAVVGYTGFPSNQDSPFCRYINEYGAQFGYTLIEEPGDVPFNFFYTSNVSMPRRVFEELGGFREDFAAAAWEDIEFAYRARRAGLRLRYQPRARTIHHHRIRPRTFCRRQRTAGRAGAVFARLHPELGEFLGVQRMYPSNPLTTFGAWLGYSLIVLGERIPGIVPVGVYRRVLDEAYLQGLAEGLHGCRQEGRDESS